MIRALLVVLALASSAHADEQQFRAAGELAARGDASAIDAFEAVGAARPASRWTDDAWVEAARLAEQRNDYARARRNLEQAIAISDDAQLVRRAKRDLERITQLGDWGAVAAEHQRLVTAIADGGDPTSELEQLEALAKAHPRYPRAVALRVAIGRGWEEEGDGDRGLAWLREAVQRDAAARPELARMLIRQRELADARREIVRVADPGARRTLERKLAAAETQQLVRWLVAAMLAVLAGVAAWLLQRRTGSWGAVARVVRRPPVEVIYFAPIAAVVGVVAATGNPLVARAVIGILAGATAIAWVSGALLATARRPLGARGAVHLLVVGIAILGAVYLAIDHARIVDLVIETTRTGPGH